MLLWCWFLWELEQDFCSHWSKHLQVLKWMGNILCRMSYYLGLQASNPNLIVCNWGWVHLLINVPMRHDSHNGSHQRNETERYSSHLYQAFCLLQGLWGQLWCTWTSQITQALSQNQAHQCLLPSLSWTCKEGPYQDLSHWYQRPNCQHSHQAISSEWFYLSLHSTMWGLTNQATNVRECYVCKYIGTYLVLPMMPMLPMIPTIPRYLIDTRMSKSEVQSQFLIEHVNSLDWTHKLTEHVGMLST